MRLALLVILAAVSTGISGEMPDGEGLSGPVINTIEIDPITDDLWLGTWGGGLVRISAGRVDRFDQFNSGLAGDLVFAVTVDDGVVWVATNGGLSAFDTIRDEWRLYAERRSDAPEVVYTDVWSESDGLFASAWCEGLHRFDPGLDEWVRVESSADESDPGQDACAPLEPLEGIDGGGVAADPQGRAIGVLGPFRRPIALPGDASRRAGGRPRSDRVAANLAVEQVNRSRKGSGKPTVRISIDLPEFTRHGWGTPEDDFVRFAREDDVLGMLGLFEPGSRIASAVAWLTGVPVVNAASTPASIEETVNPWIFRCPINDPRQQARFMDHVLGLRDEVRVAVLRTPGSLDRMHLDWWIEDLRAREIEPVAVLDLDPAAGSLQTVLQDLRESAATIVLTWTDAGGTAAILRGVHRSGLDPLFVGSDRIVDASFAKRMVRNTVDVIAPRPCSHRADPRRAAEFDAAYFERSLDRRAAGPEAHLFYDATLHLLEAIDAAGPDREAIRRKLAEMGTLSWDRSRESRRANGPD